jgi:hypothetical protein
MGFENTPLFLFPGLDPLEPLEGVTGGGETGRMGA